MTNDRPPTAFPKAFPKAFPTAFPTAFPAAPFGIVVPMTALGLAVASGVLGPSTAPPLDLPATAILVVMTGLLLVRDHAPFAVLVATTVGFLLLAFADYELDTFGLLFVAVHAVGRRWDLPWSLVALLVPLLVCLLGLLSPGSAPLDVVLFGLVGALLWAVGVQARLHEIGLRRAASQEASLRHRLRAEEDRAAIARDVHDIVAHGLGAIRIQASSALEVARSHPAIAERALAAIVEVSGGAMREIRGLVQTLRAAEAEEATSAHLQAVLERAEVLGLSVDADVDAAFDQASPAVRAAIHRVVQEATTNALRHAGATRVRVRVRLEDGIITARVQDDGCGIGGTGELVAGHGLRGMRERIEALGGRVEFQAGVAGFGVLAAVSARATSGAPA